MPALLTTMETSPQVRAALRDVVGAGHVEPNRDDVLVRDGRRVAGAAVDLGTGVEQGLRDRGAKTSIGAGNERSRTFDLHGCSFCVGPCSIAQPLVVL